MPWTVEYGYANTKEEEANPPPGMMIQDPEVFHSKRAAMERAGHRIKMSATNVVVKDGDGEVVADFDAVWKHTFPPKPTRE